MSQPAAYDRAFSFTNYQASNPSTPLPGDELDAELNNAKTTLDQILANLALIQRDDGRLANGSVGLDQLAAEVSVGFNVPQAWAQNTAYTTIDTVFYQAKFYKCTTSHTSSGAFDSTKFTLIADFSTIPVNAASAVTFTPAGNIAATNVQAAIQELDTEKAAASHTHASTDISDSTSAGRAFLTAADVATQLVLLGITNRYFKTGDIKDTAALLLETGWLWCDGSSVSRATYFDLFIALTVVTIGNTTNGSPIITNIPDTSLMRAGMPISGTTVSGFSGTILSVDSATQITMSANAIGTATASPTLVAPFGAVDASHFNLPDLRGRHRVGRDDMGGSTAGHITAAGTGVAGTRIGVTGGAETHTLTTAQLASHTHIATSTPTDPGHTHAPAAGTVFVTAAGSDGVRGDLATYTMGRTTTATASATTGVTVATTNATAGSGSAHNNMGPFQVCNSIIKT